MPAGTPARTPTTRQTSTRDSGTWEVDPARFPNGMSALKDYAHSLGMKFGIWVEPERVNRSVIGTDGLDESAIATAGGDYQSQRLRPNLPRRRRRQAVGRRSPDGAARRRATGLSQVGQQPVGELRSGRPRPRHRRRQLRARHRALPDSRRAASAIPESRHRELLAGRQPAGFRHAALHRHGVDGRSDRAVGSRAAQHRRPERDVSARLSAVVRHRSRGRVDRERARTSRSTFAAA